MNNKNSFLVYKIYDEVRFKGVKSVQINAQEIADFEPFLTSGIFSVSKSGIVEIVDYNQREGYEVTSSLDLSENTLGFEQGVEVVACTLSKDAAYAVISTGIADPGSKNYSQNSLILLQLDHNFRISILDNIKDHNKERKPSRCYTHLRITNSREYGNDPILLCFESKYGYMEVFEPEQNLNTSYSTDVYVIKGGKLFFVETLQDYHRGKSFKNEEIDGYVWSIDNRGRISQMQFE